MTADRPPPSVAALPQASFRQRPESSHKNTLCKAGKILMLSHLRGELLIIWIPAFAGMTKYLLMDYPG